MPDPTSIGEEALGNLFRLERRTVHPAASPKQLFAHFSLPSLDETGGPKLEKGEAIESAKTRVDEQCVLVSKLNPRKPRVVVADPRHSSHQCCASTEFMAFVPTTERADIRFFKWLLGSDVFQKRMERVATGSTNSHVRCRPAETMRWSVWLPPLPEQRLIAEILDTVDEAIRKTEEIIAKLGQVKQGLLNDLLTRGIDENGKLRDPDRHPEQFKDSELGRIPKEWEVVRLGEVVPRAIYGISESLDSVGRLPVLRMMNFKDGEADLTDLKFAKGTVAKELLLCPGDVLFNRTNSIDHVGRTGIWRGQIQEATFASYLVRLEPDTSRLCAGFLNLWLNWKVTQLDIRRFATPGVHQVNINPTNLRNTRVALPDSINEQARIVSAADSLDCWRNAETSQLEKLRVLKQGLMDDLLTGRVRVTSLLQEAAK